MVDAADREKVEASRNELHNLLDKPQLQGIPVSVMSTPIMQNYLWVVQSQILIYIYNFFRFWYSATKGIFPVL